MKAHRLNKWALCCVAVATLSGLAGAEKKSSQGNYGYGREHRWIGYRHDNKGRAVNRIKLGVIKSSPASISEERIQHAASIFQSYNRGEAKVKAATTDLLPLLQGCGFNREQTGIPTTTWAELLLKNPIWAATLMKTKAADITKDGQQMFELFVEESIAASVANKNEVLAQIDSSLRTGKKPYFASHVPRQAQGVNIRDMIQKIASPVAKQYLEEINQAWEEALFQKLVTDLEKWRRSALHWGMDTVIDDVATLFVAMNLGDTDDLARDKAFEFLYGGQAFAAIAEHMSPADAKRLQDLRQKLKEVAEERALGLAPYHHYLRDPPVSTFAALLGQHMVFSNATETLSTAKRLLGAPDETVAQLAQTGDLDPTFAQLLHTLADRIARRSPN